MKPRRPGLSLVTSLLASSIVPALRTIGSIARERRANPLAALMVAVNLVGITLSFVTGDARLMFAEDAAISSVIAIAILASVAYGRPMMSTGLQPFITNGDTARTAAWDHLTATSGRFRRYGRAPWARGGGDLIGRIFARDEASAAAAERTLSESLSFSEEAVEPAAARRPRAERGVPNLGRCRQARRRAGGPLRRASASAG